MISSVVPKIPFIEKEETLNYYSEGLGFELLSDWGDYLIMKKEGAELHFFHFPKLKPRKSDFMIYLRVSEGIEEFYQNVQEKGVKIHPNGPLEAKPWNQKEFSLIDPAGTLLTFGQAI
ncbi:bleomycin resistance protein [Jiulongibacter sediminis]|uniref:Bleomycin resistance protein n=1 Tax=Jiulongibacter sediminis TaxID=1605367 RepID=A0A0P7BSF5_9BACT|nr:VOC family protein [Jiulongibacter sediminis]KPM47377.1 Bleomycin resistance protein [Jiulongibacter sediminis]TBX22929.1 Bleomycin resistance protein [Jiulongibacter sediminis]